MKIKSLLISFTVLFFVVSIQHTYASDQETKEEVLLPISQNNKIGFINEKGDVVIRLQFSPNTGGNY